VQLLDADDVLAARKLEMQLAVFAEHPTATLVYGDTYSFRKPEQLATGEIKKFVMDTPPLSGAGTALALHMASDNLFLPCGALFKRSLLALNPAFNPAIVAFEDWEFWYKAVLQGAEFVYDNRAGTESYARAHGSNTTGNRRKMWQHKLKARESVMRSIKELMAKKVGQEVDAIYATHKALCYEESARFNLLYANVLTGLLDTVQYSLKGKKPLRIWYDSAYWLKERLLGRK
jgi:hypothetical protein